MIRAVIFDFGGVLMRTGEPFGRREWEARLGLPAGQLEQIVHGSELWLRAQRGQITPDVYWSGIASTLHISEADLPALRYDYFRDDRLDLDLIAQIGSLRREGYKIGLLSNDTAHLEDKLRYELAIYELFDAIIISAVIGVMKPDRGAYEAITRALGVPETECVFIDDNRANVEGARRMGMRAIHFHTGPDALSALALMLKG